jgi:hypothetical protein
MNTIAEQFTFVRADDSDQIVEVRYEPNELATASAALPIAAKVLKGYELTMRQSAAACEAGR